MALELRSTQSTYDTDEQDDDEKTMIILHYLYVHVMLQRPLETIFQSQISISCYGSADCAGEATY